MFSEISLITFITDATPITAVTLVVFLDGALKAFIPLYISIRIMERKNAYLRKQLEEQY